MATKKPLSKRAKARLAKIRRDPHGRIGLEVARYLKAHGWLVLVTGRASVRGESQTNGKMGRYEFMLEFSGFKKPTATPGGSRHEP